MTKQYKILADSITTDKGVILRKGETVKEVRFNPNAIGQLLADKAIEEITEQAPKAEAPKKPVK